MPYIKDRWTRWEIEDKTSHPKTAGELNYMFTTILQEYWRTHPGYQSINDIIGALEGTKLEFYRRVAAPYEDTKIAENGDVYE